MKRLGLALGLAVLLLPGAASAESIAVSGDSGGFTALSGGTFSGTTVNLGTYDMSAGSWGTLSLSGLDAGVDYVARVMVTGIINWDTLTAEILDPKDGDDATDVKNQPSYVPTSFTTSNDTDGLSFAQNSALERSAVFAGGSVQGTADERTDARDMLTFSGLGANSALVTFGLRDWGSRNFLLRLSANETAPTPNPEPASILLVGTVLAGFGAAYRRRLGRR